MQKVPRSPPSDTNSHKIIHMFFLEILQVTLLCQNEIIFFAQQKILFHVVYAKNNFMYWYAYPSHIQIIIKS